MGPPTTLLKNSWEEEEGEERIDQSIQPLYAPVAFFGLWNAMWPVGRLTQLMIAVYEGPASWPTPR